MGRLFVILGLLLSIALAWVFIYKSADPASYPTESEILDPGKGDPFYHWKPVTTDNIEFLLPKNPFTASEMVPVGQRQTAEYKMYVTEDLEDAVYNANVITYPEDHDFLDPMIFMPRLVRAIVAVETNYKETEMVEEEVNGLFGYRFVFHSPTQQLKGRVLNNKNQFYLMMVIQDNDKYDDEALEHFLSSLKVVSGE